MLTNERYTCLVKKYIDTVFRVALNYTKNPTDAEDIVQNVFLKLLREKKEFVSDDHIRNWLIRVAVNEGKKYVRSPWRQTVSFEDYTAALPDFTQQQKDILREVMALPPKYRLPIYLYYYEEYSTQEIADILKIPKGTVCTNLRRGREMLRKQFLEEGDFDE